MAAVRERHPQLPVVLVAQGLGGDLIDARGVTSFRSSVAAVRALGRAATYSAWLAERHAEVEAEVANAQPGDLATLLHHRRGGAALLSAEADTDGWVGAESAKRLLTDYGLQPTGGVARGAA